MFSICFIQTNRTSIGSNRPFLLDSKTPRSLTWAVSCAPSAVCGSWRKDSSEPLFFSLLGTTRSRVPFVVLGHGSKRKTPKALRTAGFVHLMFLPIRLSGVPYFDPEPFIQPKSNSVEAPEFFVLYQEKKNPPESNPHGAKCNLDLLKKPRKNTKNPQKVP